MGISTIVAGYCVWMMLFRREKNILIVATKFKVAANLVIKVKKMFQTIPDWLKMAEIKVDNQTSFELTNGSIIKASTTSINDAGRSEALSLLVIDEAAHVEGMDELWTAVRPTLARVVVNVLLYHLLTVLVTGFIKHILMPKMEKMILNQQNFPGFYIPIEMKIGLKENVGPLIKDRLLRSIWRNFLLQVKLSLILMIWSI